MHTNYINRFITSENPCCRTHTHKSKITHGKFQVHSSAWMNCLLWHHWHTATVLASSYTSINNLGRDVEGKGTTP